MADTNDTTLEYTPMEIAEGVYAPVELIHEAELLAEQLRGLSETYGGLAAQASVASMEWNSLKLLLPDSGTMKEGSEVTSAAVLEEANFYQEMSISLKTMAQRILFQINQLVIQAYEEEQNSGKAFALAVDKIQVFIADNAPMFMREIGTLAARVASEELIVD